MRHFCLIPIFDNEVIWRHVNKNIQTTIQINANNTCMELDTNMYIFVTFFRFFRQLSACDISRFYVSLLLGCCRFSGDLATSEHLTLQPDHFGPICRSPSWLWCRGQYVCCNIDGYVRLCNSWSRPLWELPLWVFVCRGMYFDIDVSFTGWVRVLSGDRSIWISWSCLLASLPPNSDVDAG